MTRTVCTRDPLHRQVAHTVTVHGFGKKNKEIRPARYDYYYYSSLRTEEWKTEEKKRRHYTLGCSVVQYARCCRCSQSVGGGADRAEGDGR